MVLIAALNGLALSSDTYLSDNSNHGLPSYVVAVSLVYVSCCQTLITVGHLEPC